MATSPHIWFFIPSKINVIKVFIPKGLPLLFYEYLPFQKQSLKEVEVTNVTNLVQHFFIPTLQKESQFTVSLNDFHNSQLTSLSNLRNRIGPQSLYMQFSIVILL